MYLLEWIAIVSQQALVVFGKLDIFVEAKNGRQDVWIHLEYSILINFSIIPRREINSFLLNPDTNTQHTRARIQQHRHTFPFSFPMNCPTVFLLLPIVGELSTCSRFSFARAAQFDWTIQQKNNKIMKICSRVAPICPEVCLPCMKWPYCIGEKETTHCRETRCEWLW